MVKGYKACISDLGGWRARVAPRMNHTRLKERMTIAQGSEHVLVGRTWDVFRGWVSLNNSSQKTSFHSQGFGKLSNFSSSTALLLPSNSLRMQAVLELVSKSPDPKAIPKSLNNQGIDHVCLRIHVQERAMSLLGNDRHWAGRKRLRFCSSARIGLRYIVVF